MGGGRCVDATVDTDAAGCSYPGNPLDASCPLWRIGNRHSRCAADVLTANGHDSQPACSGAACPGDLSEARRVAGSDG
jgi:hypothetical protein